jgi:hypothetical protein
MAELIKHPDVVVRFVGDSPHEWQAIVYDELAMRVSRKAAQGYMAETKPLLGYPNEFLSRTRAWVTVEGEVDERVLTRISRPSYLAGLVDGPTVDGRWQYAIANVGTFNSPDRMAGVLAVAGAHGWELVAIYDKASNWFQGFEKGFMLLKRPVPDGETPDEWCVQIKT